VCPHYFHSIAGRDTFSVSKPDPGHLTQVIAQAGGVPSRAVMVGDSDVDLRTAKDASVPAVLVSFGYVPRALEEFAPHAVIDHFDELVPSIDTILGGAERQTRRG